MVQPVNYSMPLPNLGLQFAMAGEAIGSAISQKRQAEQEQELRQQYSQDLQQAFQSNDPQLFAQLAAKYPTQAKGIKDAFSVLNESQQENELLTGAQVSNAIRGGKPEIAMQIVDKQIEALSNSGKPTQRMQAIRDALNADPTMVAKNLDMVMYAVAGDRWGKMTGMGGKQVQSSDILADGTVVTVFKDGSTQVTDATGNVVAGEKAASAVRQAQEFGGEVKAGGESRKIAFQKAQEIAVKAFEQIPKIETNLANLDEAIELVKQGANTGAIERNLPSFKASTIALNNVRNRLGLDVVGSVTFGALSQDELKLALDTGLPTNLEGQDLINWITNKKQAQTKLLGYLNEQAEFLSSGDKTLNDWMKFKKKQKADFEKSVPEPLRNRSYIKALPGNK